MSSTHHTRRGASGQFEAVKGTRGTVFRFRFTLSRDGYPDVPDKDRRVSETLGRDYGEGAITRKEAEARADRLLAQVRLGQYRTKTQRAAERAAREGGRTATPLFGVLDGETAEARGFATEWFERRKAIGGRRGRGLSVSGENDLLWRLEHLTAWFGELRLDEITEEEVERYAAAKRGAPLRAGGLGATSVNKTLSTLEAILATAVRHRKVERNAVAGYRVPNAKYVAAILDTAAQARALLDAAGDLDQAGRLRHGHGRALLATLLFGGLRIDEALSLRWRDVRLPERPEGPARRLRAVEDSGWLKVRDGKTVNAARTVDLLPPLERELRDLRARRGGDRDALVFGTGKGGKDSASNVRRRILAPAIEAANAVLEKASEETIPARLTPHGLRHTHVSVRFLLGEEAGYVADQVGHADAGFTYSRYRKRIERRDGEPERLRALFYGPGVEPPETGEESAAA